jgi:hypothetical protein
MTTRVTTPRAEASAPPGRRARWLVGAIIGSVIGFLVGMLGVTVGGASDEKMWPNERLTVAVFGVTVHEGTSATGAGRAQIWGLGLSAGFAVAGALLGAVAALLSSKPRGGAAPVG